MTGPHEVAGLRLGSRIARTVIALASALMPVRLETWSTGIGIRGLVRAVLWSTIMRSWSRSATSGKIGMQTCPRPCVIMNAIDLRGDFLGRGDEVALVLAILVVDHDDDPAVPQSLECVVDLGVFLTHRLVLPSNPEWGRSWNQPHCTAKASPGGGRHGLGPGAGSAPPRRRKPDGSLVSLRAAWRPRVHGSSRIRRFLNSTGEPSDSRQR